MSRPSSIRFVYIEQLETSYAPLRAGRMSIDADAPAAQPLRVVPTDDGTYEVVDGFKRLEAWKEADHSEVPVVVEPSGDIVEHKRLLLTSNAPRRTLTVLDEARVAASLHDDDGLSETAIARLLGRRRRWVSRRIDISLHLSRAAEQRLATGAIGPTVAHKLCAIAAPEQDKLLDVIERNGLTVQQTLRLLAAYRAADGPDRREILANPVGTVCPRPPVSLSPLTVELESRLHAIQQALAQLTSFTIPDELAPPERRRIEALHRGVLAQLYDTAQALAQHPGPNPEESHHVKPARPRQQPQEPAAESAVKAPAPPQQQQQRRGDPGDQGGDSQAPPVLRSPQDRCAGRPDTKDSATNPRGGGSARADRREPGPAEQAGAIPEHDRTAGAQGP